LSCLTAGNKEIPRNRTLLNDLKDSKGKELVMRIFFWNELLISDQMMSLEMKIP